MNKPHAKGTAPAPDLASHATSAYSPWLHAYALLFIFATYLLVTIGGNVTSLGVGLAVPGGWWTFDYFTLWAPLSEWWHDMGTRWEHSHRLKGYLVGAMTIGLAIWLWLSQPHRPWLQWLGVGLLVLVIVQGVMGALRVDLISQFFATVHGITGQLFFALTVLVAAATSRIWLQCQHPQPPSNAWSRRSIPPLPTGLKWFALALLFMLVVQLTLGAWMRHNVAGGAIPDFPLNYGHVIPPFTQPELFPGYNVTQVAVHFAHRVVAYVLIGMALALLIWLNLRAAGRREIAWPVRWLMLLFAAQFALGAWTVWSERFPEIATAHQSLGAIVLAVSTWLTIRIYLLDRTVRASADLPAAPSPPPPAESPQPAPSAKELPA